MPYRLRPSLRSAGTSVLLALVVAACSTPTETAAVQSPSAASMRNLAVFAGGVNAADRRALEDTYVDELSRYGVHATPSYSLFSVGEVPDDQATIRAFLQRGGYNGALVSTAISAAAPVLVAPGMDWARGFLDSYAESRVAGDAPIGPHATFETTLWNPSSGKMVWSAFTETEYPMSGRDFAPSLAGKVVSSLARQGLIPARQERPVSLAK